MKVPATVVTGFLGAGKTTLIRHLLENAGGKRIALVVNEFGSVGVDGEILAACGVEGCADEEGAGVIELANGCICCTVADDFIPTIEALLGRKNPPEHIVIETSGLALPQPLIRAFAWPEIKTRVTVDGVVTVVDGAALAEGRFAADEAAVAAQREEDESLDHETPLGELFADQLACADLVVVNKLDLLAPETAATLEKKLRGDVRPGVAVLRATRGAINPAVALGLGVGAEDDLSARREVHHHHHDHDHDHDHDHHHDHDHAHDHGGAHDHHHGHAHDHHHGHAHDHGHDAFATEVFALGEVASVDALTEAVAATCRAENLLRLKGFAAVAGKPMRLVVQAVGPRVEIYFDQPWPAGAPRETKLVAIGLAGLDAGAVAAGLARAAAKAAA